MMGYQCAALQRPSPAVQGGGGGRRSLATVFEAALVVGQFVAGHAGDFVDRWQALDEAGDEVRGARTVAAVATGVPDGDLVDGEVGDGLHLLLDDGFHLLDHEERGRGTGVTTRAFHEVAVTGCLGLKDGLDTLGFGLEAGQGCVGLTTGDAALALGFCLGGDFDLCLGDFLTCDFLSTEPLGLQVYCARSISA